MPQINVDGVGKVNVSDSFFSLAEPDQQKTVNEIYESYKGKSKQQEIKDSEQSENFLFKTLDNINRPQYAIANAIYQKVTNEDYSTMQALWDGATLKEKRSIGDTLREVIEPESKFGKLAVGVAGFAGDVLTDPLTYTGVGLVNRAGKLVKAGSTTEKMIKAGRSIGKAQDTKATLKFAGKAVPQSEKIIDPLAKGVSKVGRAIREDLGPISEAIDKLRTVSTKMRPKGTDPVEWQKYIRATEKAKNIQAKIELDSFDKARQISKAFRDEGLDDNAIARVTGQLETKGDITSRGGQIAKEFGTEMQDLYKNVGKTGKMLIDDESIDYVPHVLEKKAGKLKDATGFSKRDWTTKSPSDIKRTLLKYTDDSGNEFVLSTKSGKAYKDGVLAKTLKQDEIKDLNLSQASISDINKAYGDTVFSTKLPKLMAIQGMRTAKVVGGDEFFKNVSVVGSKVAKDNYVTVKAPELAGKYFDPEIAKHVDKTYDLMTKPEEVDTFFRNYDKIQNAWKTTATYWNAAFHTRNAISNVWQNTLAGVNNPKDYARATKMQWNLRKGADNLSPNDKILYNEYKEQGLQKVGHLSGDIDQSIESQIMSAMDMAKKGKVIGVVNKASGQVGDMVESNAKIAHFIAKRRDGLSAYDAGQSVKKYLFDYGDLTHVERKGLKRVIPFYTFTRKNIPLQLEALIKTPARQTKLIKLKNNVEVYAGDDKTSELLPEYLKQAAPVYVGKKDGKVRYIKLEGFLPTADLNKLSLSEGAQELLSMITPLIKAPAEQAANYNFFFGKEITRHKGIKNGFTGTGERDYLWWRIPGRLEHLGRLFRPHE